VITYVDSSALVAVYVPESFSRSARGLVMKAGQIPFTRFHDLEVRNGFELLRGRRLITDLERDAVIRHLEDDLENQRLVALPLDLDSVFADAVELSRLHSSKVLARSLDVLHVAAARAAACTEFVSADDRQLALAKASGLKTTDIKRIRRAARRRP
jgi:predicted nucleic acid-binding protein